jgi:hypothetical protein
MVTGSPYGTRRELVTWTLGDAQMRLRRHWCGPVWTRSVVHRSTYLTTLIFLTRPPCLTCSTTTTRRSGFAIFCRLTSDAEPVRRGSASGSLVEAQFPTLSHALARNVYVPVKPASSN